MRDLQTQQKPLHPILSRSSILLLGILAGALALRLYNLGALPIFTDEAINSGWALEMWIRRTRDVLFIPVREFGKQPLYPWAVAAGMGLNTDPLTTGRIVSAIAGTASTLGTYVLARRIYGSSAGFLAAAFYSLMPLATFHERMALIDPMLSAALLFACLAAFEAARATSRPRGLVLWATTGLLLGAATWIKLSAVLYCFLPIVAWMLFAARKRNDAALSAVLCYLPLLAAIGGLALMPDAIQTVIQTASYTQPFSKETGGPLAILGTNLGKTGEWLAYYVGIIALVAAGLAWGIERSRSTLYLAVFATVPFLAFVLVGARIYSRYVLPAAAPIAILAAVSILATVRLVLRYRSTNTQRLAMGVLAAVVALSWVQFDSALVQDPTQVGLPEDDRYQYIDGWPSGYAMDQALRAVDEVARSLQRPTILLTDPIPGLPRDAVRIHYFRSPLVTLHTEAAIQWGGASISADWRQHRVMTFVLVSDYRDNWQALEQDNPEMKLVGVYWKPGQKSYFRLYSADFGVSGAETTPAANNAAGTR